MTPLADITTASEALLTTASRLTNEDVRRPSLLPGWTRGHVLTHLARNADGGTRLLTWARTGAPSHEYPSLDARAADIEHGSTRAAAELLADVRESAARFAAAYTAMPADAWGRVVQWTSGASHPAARATDARLTEVLMHHVDLDAGFTPADWPTAWTTRTLQTVVTSFARRPDAPSLHLHTTDTNDHFGPQDGHRVEGPATALLAWLTGRTDGTALEGAADVTVPFLY